MIRTEDYAQVEVTSARQLRDWLVLHHTQERSIWLVTFKKHVADRYVSTPEILDEILCFGWIDGLRRKLDSDRVMQLLSPRRQQVWAATYKDRVVRLTALGQMHPAGLAAAERSRAAGVWSKLDHVDALIIPGDLAAGLLVPPDAAAGFDGFAPSYRRNVLRWLAQARTPDTRARRIAAIVQSSKNARKLPNM